MLDGSSSTDRDGRISSFAWSQSAGPSIVLDRASTATASFEAPAVEQNTQFKFTLTVTDDDDATAHDPVAVTVVPRTYAVSGTITAPSNVQVDSDVNDPDAPYAPNDTPETAQPIGSAIVVGGYVTQPGAGEDGARKAEGDVSDFYRASLTAGEQVRLRVADPDEGDIDLYLWDADGTSILDFSAATSRWETVIAPEGGELLIEASAESGASNYSLIVGEAHVAPAERLQLSAEFVPDEIVLARRPAGQFLAQSHTSVLEALGASTTSDATGRPVLARLDPVGPSASQALPSARSLRSAHREAAIADPRLRRKYATLLAVKALRRDPAILYAHPNYLAHADAVPDDPYYDRQWDYPMIRLPAAWERTRGDSAVEVGVLDTGVLSDHPDLAGQLAPGYDFISDPERSADGDGLDPDPYDAGDGDGSSPSTFHGTHVTGTIAAATDNGIGVAGVAPGVTVLPLRVLGIDGGSTYDILQAVRYASGLENDSGAIRPPVDVINMSLGSRFACLPSEQQALDQARAQGVVIVASAGNDAEDVVYYAPATCDGVIAVGAVDRLGQRAYYSNFGSSIDVWAPGGDLYADADADGYWDGIYSLGGDADTDPPTPIYVPKHGTSMAAPHVAGVVALMRTVNPDLAPKLVDQLLFNGEMTDDRGIIDADAAVSAAVSALTVSPRENPTLTVRPASLSFGAALSYGEIDLQVAGGGTLEVGQPAASEHWLTVSAVQVTDHGTGLYGVGIDRTGLAEGSYSSVISIGSTNNRVDVPVTMQVSRSNVAGNAGHVHVLLLEVASRRVVDWVELDPTDGRYDYEFPDLRPGEYEIFAGTDIDHDGYICDDSESCGAYPLLYQTRRITLDQDRTHVDFSVRQAVPMGAAAAVGALRVGNISKSVQK